jgi:hypothetical protein
LAEDQIHSPSCHLGWFDMHTIQATPERLMGQLVPSADVTAYGLLVWFDVELTADIAFGTGPHHPPTHWRQVFLPFPEPLAASPARPLQVTISPPRDVEGNDSTWAWRISDGENVQQVDERDTLARCGRL